MGAATVKRWLPPIRPSSSSSPSSSWYPDNFVVDPDVVDDHIAGTDVGPLVKYDADRCNIPGDAALAAREGRKRHIEPDLPPTRLRVLCLLLSPNCRVFAKVPTSARFRSLHLLSSFKVAYPLLPSPGTSLKGCRFPPLRRASLHGPTEPTDPPETPSRRPVHRLLPPWSSLSRPVSSARPAVPFGPDAAVECPRHLAPRQGTIRLHDSPSPVSSLSTPDRARSTSAWDQA